MICDLEAEMDAAFAKITTLHIRRLLGVGCSWEALSSLNEMQTPFGVGRVRWLAGGFYEPDDDGEATVITPVVRAAQTIDLVAWRSTSPQFWSLRTGLGWALGEELLDYPNPLPVTRTPLEWIASGGNSLCILDWDAPAIFWSMLRSGPPLVLPDDALRLKLQNTMVGKVAMPVMEVGHAAEHRKD